MLRKIYQATILSAFFVASFTQSAPVSAKSSKSLEIAKSFMDEMIKLSTESKNNKGSESEESKKKIKDLSSRIDFEQLSKRSFGAKWATFKASERADFASTLQELLEVTVYPRAQKFSASSDGIRYAPLAGKAGVVQVLGKIEREKNGDLVQQEIEIDLHVDSKKSKIFDAIIEGELLSANLKRQFSEALKKKTFAALIAQMKKRIDESKPQK